MPLCVGVLALAIDVSYWEVKRVQLQHVADLAALAGSVRYSQTNNASAAVWAAASVAELNSVPAGTRTINGSAVLTDNYGDWVTSYSFNATTASLTATIQTTAPIFFGRLYTAATKQTISATAVAQATTTIGGHPCVLATKGDTTGVNTYVDLAFSGNTSVTSTTCGVRSDGALTISGNASISVPTVIASGSITTSGNGSISCPTSGTSCQQSEAPQVPDPFSSAYGNALSVPSSGQAGSSSSSSTGVTYNPGVYASGLSFSNNGSYTLNPGVYYVNGSISISGNATLSGSGVTLISTGGISMSGNSTVNLTAPSTGPTAGLLFGTSTTTGTVSLTGNSSNVLNGAVYAPNTNVKLTGNSSANANPSSCFEIVAATVGFTGNSGFTNAGCGSLGVPTLYNSPLVTRLIQ